MKMQKIKNEAFRVFIIIASCIVTVMLSLHLLMFGSMLIKYFLTGEVANIKYNFILYSKLSIMAGFISGVGSCFMKNKK